MSKGTKVVTFRCPPALEAEMDMAITSRNWNSKDALWGRSDFIIAAIKEKLAHLRRSRGKKGRAGEGK